MQLADRNAGKVQAVPLEAPGRKKKLSYIITSKDKCGGKKEEKAKRFGSSKWNGKKAKAGISFLKYYCIHNNIGNTFSTLRIIIDGCSKDKTELSNRK